VRSSAAGAVRGGTPSGCCDPEAVQERAILWRVPEAPDVDLLRAHYVRHAFSPHTHEEYAVGVIETGVEEFRWRGALQRAPAGSVVVVEPDVVHTGSAGAPQGWRYRMLYLPAGAVRHSAFPRPVLHDPDLARRLRAVHLTLQHPTGALERQEGLQEVLRDLVARHARSPLPPRSRALHHPDHPAVRRAVAHLHECRAGNPSLVELAEVAGLSPWHLTRVFRVATGLTPHAYLVDLRLRDARRLLRAGTPPGDVAARCGFSDQSHLSRHFRRATGLAPGAFAASRSTARTSKTGG